MLTDLGNAAGCPIRDAGGHALAPPNITGLTDRWTLERIDAFAPKPVTEIATTERGWGSTSIPSPAKPSIRGFPQ